MAFFFLPKSGRYLVTLVHIRLGHAIFFLLRLDNKLRTPWFSGHLVFDNIADISETACRCFKKRSTVLRSGSKKESYIGRFVVSKVLRAGWSSHFERLRTLNCCVWLKPLCLVCRCFANHPQRGQPKRSTLVAVTGVCCEMTDDNRTVSEIVRFFSPISISAALAAETLTPKLCERGRDEEDFPYFLLYLHFHLWHQGRGGQVCVRLHTSQETHTHTHKRKPATRSDFCFAAAHLLFISTKLSPARRI